MGKVSEVSEVCVSLILKTRGASYVVRRTFTTHYALLIMFSFVKGEWNSMKYKIGTYMTLLCLLTGAAWCGSLPYSMVSAEEIPAAASKDTAIKKVTYRPEDKARYEVLRQENAGHLAPKERFITTTTPDIVLTFGGLTRRESIEDMLDHLDVMHAKATFFVTELELRKYSDTIDEILRRGHELGLGLRTGTDGDFYETCAQIERLQKNMERRFGVRPAIARQVFGTEKAEVNEACSAMGVRLVGQTVNMVQTKDKEATAAEEIFSTLFGAKVTSLGRGQIIYGRLDFLDSPKLSGELLELIKTHKIDNIAYRKLWDSPENNPNNDSSYGMTSVGRVLVDSSKQWIYPVPEDKILPSLRDMDFSQAEVGRNFDIEFYRKYIGAPTVNDTDRVQGFSTIEMEQMDHSGVIKGVETPTIFLTFDDWSNDRSINELLYVLRKHHVTGTFFIITWNVKNNPNLLRAIAEEGHTIASHTHSHRPMVFQTSNYGGNMVPMTKEEYEKDVKQAYSELTKVVGDVVVDGKPMLTRFIRPPTLAINKEGIKSIFRAGYTFIVSGYESTDDYAAPSMQTMIGAIQHGIYDETGKVRKGSIIIMHMTDAAKYTAAALDEILTINEQRDDKDPKKFQVGRLADYLTDSYDQSSPDQGNYETHLIYKAGCC